MTQLAARAGGRFGIGRVLRGRKPGRLHHIQAQGKCASRRRGALIRPAPANGTATVSRTASIAFGSCTCCARAWVLPHFRCSSRPGDQGKALRCRALPTSRTAPVSNRQQARNRPRTSFALNEITVLVLLHLHRKCGRTGIWPQNRASPLVLAVSLAQLDLVVGRALLGSLH